MFGLLAALIAFTFPLVLHAEYAAPVSTEWSLTDIHVNKDWTVLQRMEVIKKVETDQGISLLGEQRITFNSAHEKVRVIRAYTLQPDGSKDLVTLDRIRTQDDQADAANGIYSESKAKVIIFPNVRLGSKTWAQGVSLASGRIWDVRDGISFRSKKSGIHTLGVAGRSRSEVDDQAGNVVF